MSTWAVFPQVGGENSSAQPCWESTVLLEGKGARQDDLGDKVACSSEPGLLGLTAEEEALGHLRLGSGALRGLDLGCSSGKWGQSPWYLPTKDKASADLVNKDQGVS